MKKGEQTQRDVFTHFPQCCVDRKYRTCAYPNLPELSLYEDNDADEYLSKCQSVFV